MCSCIPSTLCASIFLKFLLLTCTHLLIPAFDCWLTGCHCFNGPNSAIPYDQDLFAVQILRSKPTTSPISLSLSLPTYLPTYLPIYLPCIYYIPPASLSLSPCSPLLPPLLPLFICVCLFVCVCVCVCVWLRHTHTPPLPADDKRK